MASGVARLRTKGKQKVSDKAMKIAEEGRFVSHACGIEKPPVTQSFQTLTLEYVMLHLHP